VEDVAAVEAAAGTEEGDTQRVGVAAIPLGKDRLESGAERVVDGIAADEQVVERAGAEPVAARSADEDTARAVAVEVVVAAIANEQVEALAAGERIVAGAADERGAPVVLRGVDAVVAAGDRQHHALDVEQDVVAEAGHVAVGDREVDLAGLDEDVGALGVV